MTKDRLLATAKGLQQPGNEAAAEFESKQDRLAAELNRRMSARPDLDRLIGADNQPMMEDNSRNFTRFMSNMFGWYEPGVLVENSVDGAEDA